jgi:hypothetical protein
LLIPPASVASLSSWIVAATAAFVSFAYLLTIVLDYPYAGEVSVDSSPYKQGVLAQFWGEDQNPRPLNSKVLGKLEPEDLLGKWNSDQAYGEMLFRRVGSEIRGTYRLENGTITGVLGEDGVFRGWWCDEPDRTPPDHAGDVEWRLLREAGSRTERLDGRWRYGDSEPFRGGWDLTRIEGRESQDLAMRFEDPAAFCPHP